VAEERDRSGHDYTTGSVLGHILRLSLLTGLYQLLESGYYLADLYWVGRLGQEATAAVTMAGHLQLISMGLAMTLMVGATPIVAQAIGARADRDLRPLYNQTLLLGLSVAALFTVAGFAVIPSYFGWLGAGPESAALGRDYLVWVVPAFALKLAAMSMIGPMRADGDLIRPALANAAALVVNGVLDPVFIFGAGPVPALGVTGAALSTLIGAVVAFALMLGQYERRRRPLLAVPAPWRPRPALWGRILRIGLPVGANAAIDMTWMFVLYLAIRDLGTAVQAGVGIAFKIVGVATLPVYAIAFSIAPIVGQNVGAGDLRRVRRAFHATCAVSGGAMLACAVGLQVAAEAVARPFSTDPATVEAAAAYLVVVAWALPSMAILNNALGVFEGIGNTVKPTSTDLVRLGVFAAVLAVMARFPGFSLLHLTYATLISYAVQTALLPPLLYLELRRSER
jgi:putative MATE family efflux protein